VDERTAGGNADAAGGRFVVVFYSLGGRTRKIAEMLAAELGCPAEEIRETVPRRGFGTFLKAGRDAATGRTPPIEPLSPAVRAARCVVVGTPVWASTMAPAVRTFLSANRGEIARAAFFCTMGCAGAEKTFAAMETLLGAAPAAAASFLEREVRAGASGRVRDFAEVLRAAVPV